MANDDFSPKQKEYLNELVATLAGQLTEILDQRFAEERVYTKSFIDEQSAYLTQLFREELRKLREDLTKLDTRETNDARESVEQWETFNRRLTELEQAFKKLTAAQS